MAKFFHILTILGTIVGGFMLLEALTADSAPKQAAAAAVAVAFGVLPYCFARACTELAAPSPRRSEGQVNDREAAGDSPPAAPRRGPRHFH